MSASADFPPGFFSRQDPTPDPRFYAAPRLVTHIDAGAIAAVGALYEELRIEGRVLDLMSSWISHFTAPPADLVDMPQQVGRVLVDPVGARPHQLVLAIAARQQADAERPGAPRRQHVPDAVAHHAGALDRLA